MTAGLLRFVLSAIRAQRAWHHSYITRAFSAGSYRASVGSYCPRMASPARVEMTWTRRGHHSTCRGNRRGHVSAQRAMRSSSAYWVRALVQHRAYVDKYILPLTVACIEKKDRLEPSIGCPLTVICLLLLHSDTELFFVLFVAREARAVAAPQIVRSISIPSSVLAIENDPSR